MVGWVDVVGVLAGQGWQWLVQGLPFLCFAVGVWACCANGHCPNHSPAMRAPAPAPALPVFVCWAIDLDSQTVSQPDVYAVFMAVPVPGRAVEQPDGDIMYGAGQQQGGGAYQPPNVAAV